MKKSAFLFSFVILFVSASSAHSQQLRSVVSRVDAAVVVIKTVEKNVLPASQPMFVSSPGIGSGVLISGDGRVLTASHVVQAADKIEVEFIDGQLVPAKVIASVPRADLALLKLDWVPTNAVSAKLGDSARMVLGDDVFVIGAPYGISHSLSVGHVSARRPTNVSLGGSLKVEVLQTDAAINRGNSGGPMFNMTGEVVGIVSHIFSQSGGFEGLGFAVASNVAQKVLLETTGYWSGIDGMILSDDGARIFNIPQAAGFLVQRIADNSPASKIGLIGGSYKATIAGQDFLVGGDIILAVGGVDVTPDGSSSLEVLDYVNKARPGESVTIKLLRAGQIVELQVRASQQ